MKSSTRNNSKRATGKVFVEKAAVLDDLIEGLENPTGFGSEGFSASESQTISNQSKASTVDHIKLLKDQQRQRNVQTELIMKQNIQKSIERESEKQEKLFPVLLSNVDKATSFLDTIDRDINLHDETQKNKARRQFEDWNSAVHGKIQRNISKKLNGLDSKELNKRKNEDYAKFLTITNRKPAIFRDIIIENEYDPLQPNRQCIKARTGFLKDPVKIDAQKAAAEGSMLGDGPNSSKDRKGQKLCKETLNVELWASGQIEATPYGTFAKMMSGSGGATQRPSGKSSIVFDHFNYPQADKAAIDREMPRGKRIHPVTIYADPKMVYNDRVPPSFDAELSEIKPPDGTSYLK